MIPDDRRGTKDEYDDVAVVVLVLVFAVVVVIPKASTVRDDDADRATRANRAAD